MRVLSEIPVVVAVNGKHIAISHIRTESAAYMLISVFLILFTLALEIAPVFLYFLKESGQSVFTRKAWMLIGGITFLLFIVNLAVTVFSLRMGVNKIERLQL
ncbi:MAG: hypothetical protein M1461_04350 [Nitrospirae bacterium]|nr:hypothetical protein [Nitrospirota bacterium]